MLFKSTKLQAKEHTYVQWMVAILANTTLLTYGLQSGWISPMTKVLQADVSPLDSPLSDTEISWIASTMCLSAVFGVSMYAFIADTYGRRVGIIAIAIPQALCWILKLFTTSTTGLIIARICCGIPAGGCFNLIPMYVKEISQDNIRGLLGSLMILMQNIGILTMYAMGSYLEYHTVLWIVLGIPILTVVLMLKAPESPAYLVKVGKTDEAAATIAFLRGLDVDDKSIQNEISYMSNDDLYYKSLPKISYLSILKNKPWRHAFLLSIAMISVGSINGNFAILTYASTILASSGVTFSPELQTLSFPAVMILGSFISMCCVEKVGRRIILAVAHMVTVLALVCLASTQLVLDQGTHVPGWLPVLAIVMSLCAYSAGIRAKALGFIVTYAWLMSFVQLSLFAWARSALGAQAAFYGFAAVNLLGVMVAWCLPETRGKTVDEIEVELRKK
ncbi:Sugar transporter 4 [Operophtera brumata]|uniref:Sugar transporter 4 n=1 Tax=Operophtera brumata TaxID=104452 RepID=A0A0L7L525_OPEBR|nr:Sugar transporter 4 [Operophtera brumata]